MMFVQVQQTMSDHAFMEIVGWFLVQENIQYEVNLRQNVCQLLL